MLTYEGSFSGTTHIVKDKVSGRIRLLIAEETSVSKDFQQDTQGTVGW